MSIAAVLNALAAIPTIVSLVESFAGAVCAWYLQRQSSQTLSGIIDAAAQLAGAKSDADRFAGIEALQKSLSRPRITS